jgi:hypothetical protein
MATAVSGRATIGKAVPRVGQDAWSGHDTNPDAIDTALRRLLRQRHAASRALAPARVLNLVVVAERGHKDAIARRLERVGRYEASRTILCSVEEERRTLDATVVMSYAAPDDGGLQLIHEKVEIEIGPEHLDRLDTIVDPQCSPPSCRRRSGGRTGSSDGSTGCSRTPTSCCSTPTS